MARLRAKTLKRNSLGQGITEYGAVIAFVALLVAMTFGFTSGKMLPALSAAFSAVVTNLNSMSTAGGAASS